MQPAFEASREFGLIKPILREVHLAKKNKYPIVVLEYKTVNPDNQKTLEFITKEVQDYARFVMKYKDNGADYVDPVIRSLTRSKKIRVLGVNTGACVKSTVNALTVKGYTVEIVADACWDSFAYLHYKQIALFKKKNIVRVLRYNKPKS